MVASTALTDQQVAAIKKVFRQWDKDNSGFISRENLKEVMQEISALTEHDLDKLMREADRNRNGIIEYEEFVDWLSRPAQESQARAILDFSEVLRPLFDVLDRSATGFISYEDFKECHDIMQAALKKHVSSSRPSSPDGKDQDEPPEGTASSSLLGFTTPLQLQEDADVAFREVDVGGDGAITFQEFVDHLKPLLRTDRVRLLDLITITENLARMLRGVFRLREMAKAEGLPFPGERDEDKDEVLEALMGNLARTAQKFEEALALEPSAHAAINLWTEPPAGLNIETLKCKHMSNVPLSMRHVEDVTWEVLVVPSPDGQAIPLKRRWLGELARKSRIKKNKKFHVEAPAYYVYEPQRLQWEPLPDSHEFNEALDKLPLELGVFCCLKSEANFGIELDWAAILAALRCAVNMDLITRNDVKQYESWMRFQVLRYMQTEGSQTDAAHVDDWFERKLTLRPRLVMATLTDLGIVQASPVWKEFMQH